LGNAHKKRGKKKRRKETLTRIITSIISSILGWKRKRGGIEWGKLSKKRTAWEKEKKGMLNSLLCPARKKKKKGMGLGKREKKESRP